jgi:ketosteroid isomerase-like protein
MMRATWGLAAAAVLGLGFSIWMYVDNRALRRTLDPRATGSRHDGGTEERMNERKEFLSWFESTWREGEIALHNGDARPRFATWSDRPPLTLFGAWFTATDPDAVHSVFRRLAAMFSDVKATSAEVIAADVSGDLAYTVHRERTSVSVEHVPRDYVLRVTQVYRREQGTWKVVHRHADPDQTSEPAKLDRAFPSPPR